jgi:hypothetical protein
MIYFSGMTNSDWPQLSRCFPKAISIATADEIATLVATWDSPPETDKLLNCGKFLIFGYETPVENVARALENGNDPELALQNWKKEAIFIIDTIRNFPSQVILIDIPATLSNTSTLLNYIEHRFGAKVDLEVNIENHSNCTLLFQAPASSFCQGDLDVETLMNTLNSTATISSHQKTGPDWSAWKSALNQQKSIQQQERDRCNRLSTEADLTNRQVRLMQIDLNFQVEVTHHALTAIVNDFAQIDQTPYPGSEPSNIALSDENTAVLRALNLISQDFITAEQVLQPKRSKHFGRRFADYIVKNIKYIRDTVQLRGSPLFDSKWYQAQYPDVEKSGLGPAQHYLLHGGKEGRAASPQFCSQAYLDRYPDVRAKGVNPLIHYLNHNLDEPRQSFPACQIDGVAK